jgi:hypothetical protein
MPKGKINANLEGLLKVPIIIGKAAPKREAKLSSVLGVTKKELPLYYGLGGHRQDKTYVIYGALVHVHYDDYKNTYKVIVTFDTLITPIITKEYSTRIPLKEGIFQTLQVLREKVPAWGRMVDELNMEINEGVPTDGR